MAMASDLSAYLGNFILRWLNGNAAMPSPPAGLYIGLFDGNPKTTGTEISTTIAVTGRVAVTFATLASGPLHLLTSDIDVDFGIAAGAATLSHLALFDAQVAGTLLASRAIVGGSQSVLAGASVKFLAGGITFNIGADS
jgi:hypothetical protein